MLINKSGHIGRNGNSKITKKRSKTCCPIFFLCKIELKRNFEHFFLVLPHCAPSPTRSSRGLRLRQQWEAISVTVFLAGRTEKQIIQSVLINNEFGPLSSEVVRPAPRELANPFCVLLIISFRTALFSRSSLHLSFNLFNKKFGFLWCSRERRPSQPALCCRRYPHQHLLARQRNRVRRGSVSRETWTLQATTRAYQNAETDNSACWPGLRH